VLIFLSQVLLHVSKASECSKLNLTPSNTINDDNYLIQTEKIKSSNIFKVLLIMKQIVRNTSWFMMGASDSSKLIGSWHPFTSIDGQVIECSLPSEQVVTNQNSRLENSNQFQFSFYWMAPPLFSNTVIFVATIFDSNSENDQSSLKYIQSIPIQIEQIQGRERYQDVSPSMLFYSKDIFIKYSI
jgi:hypothetical protein